MEYEEIQKEIEKLMCQIEKLTIAKNNIAEQNSNLVRKIDLDHSGNCIMCGKVGKQGHHLYPGNWQFCSIDVPVVWLCSECHIKIHFFYNHDLDMIKEMEETRMIERLAQDIFALKYIKKALEYINSFSQSP